MEVIVEGLKASVEEAREQILCQVSRLENFVRICLEVDKSHHGELIGKDGANIAQLHQAYPGLQFMYRFVRKGPF